MLPKDGKIGWNRVLLWAGMVMLVFAGAAMAQPIPPFYGGAVTAFDAQISVVNAGALLDAQAVVSSDQRYVTINSRADNSTVLALRQFQVAAVASAAAGGPTGADAGFVGGANPTGDTRLAVAHTTPSEIAAADANAISVLNRRGVFLLSRLK